MSEPLHATPDATQAHAEQVTAREGLHADAFRPLGRTGLVTAAVGFGSYRVTAEHEPHRRALQHALDKGVNLIDTSTNYADGNSEKLVGEVLRDRLAQQPQQRGEVIVVTKAGYVQGENMQLAQEREESGHPIPEIVKYHEQVWHCIHPDFLADQLRRSLDRLRLDTVDVLLLHNPEYFLSDWVHHNPGGDLETARKAFYERIAAAFEFMERCVQEGTVSWYGVSSNTFGYPPASPEFVSVARLVELGREAARRVHGDPDASHFAVVQCPLNLLEPGAALEPNQNGDGRTFLDVAREAGLGVLVNRPLNAIAGGRLIRLADIPPPRPEVEDDIRAVLDDLQREEQAFGARFRPVLAAQLPAEAGPTAPFEWSGPIREAYSQIGYREQWVQILHDRIYPHIAQNGQAIVQALQEQDDRTAFGEWFNGYAQAMERLAGLVAEFLARSEHEQAQAIERRLQPLLPEPLQQATLSQQALRTLTSLDGVSCVLNGIRRTEYVDDSTAALHLPPLTGEQSAGILHRLQSSGQES